jgi:hypothetical protein
LSLEDILYALPLQDQKYFDQANIYIPYLLCGNAHEQDKSQTSQQQKQASHAISIYYEIVKNNSGKKISLPFCGFYGL